MKRIENKSGNNFNVQFSLNLKYMHFWLSISKTNVVALDKIRVS